MITAWESDLSGLLLSGTLPEVFDSHAHFLDENFEKDRDEVISGLSHFHVTHVMEAACHVSDIPKILQLCGRYPDLFVGAAGIHPEQADEFSPAGMDVVRNALSKSCIRAVGEIGLDYHFDDNPPRQMQMDCFDAHLSLAGESHKPVLIHDRDAHGDCMDLLRAHRNSLSGVMHCFSGSYETAKECLDLGLYIGVGGSSTFKNARKINEIIPRIPLDRILLETDCPYMAPEPYRGHRNDSRYMQLSLSHIASVRPEPLDEIASVILRSTLDLFGF